MSCIDQTRGSIRNYDPDQGSAYPLVGFEPRDFIIAGEIHGGRDGHDHNDGLSDYRARRGYPGAIVAVRATPKPLVQPRR